MSDEQTTILCIATRLWDSLWRDSQQVMSRLAAQYRVLYFEPGRDPDRPHAAEMWRNWPNLLRLRAREVRDNVVVIPTPSSLPYARRHLPRPLLRATVPLVANLNASLLKRHVRRALEAFDVRESILWLYEPRHSGLVGQFGERLSVYYNYDEMPGFAGNERIANMLRAYDDRLSRRVDVVFATSRGQWERRRALNPSTYFVPNGVDFDLFHRALAPETRVPADLAGLARPIIGLVGWLGYQLDVDLLLLVAERFSHGSLVLIGPDHIPDGRAARRLHALPNVHFLGRKDLAALPAYLKGIDAALIPYVLRGHTLTVYPLKLHEYLAAGRATVATALPELKPYEGVVRIAQSYEQYLRYVGEAVDDYSPLAVEARVGVARQNTWDARVALIRRILRDHLAAGKGERAVEEGFRLLDEIPSAK